jgi:hypothetical protein
MSDHDEHKRAEDQRLEVLVDALGTHDPADRTAMRDLYRAVQHMAEYTVSAIMKRPHLVQRSNGSGRSERSVIPLYRAVASGCSTTWTSATSESVACLRPTSPMSGWCRCRS